MGYWNQCDQMSSFCKTFKFFGKISNPLLQTIIWLDIFSLFLMANYWKITPTIWSHWLQNWTTAYQRTLTKWEVTLYNWPVYFLDSPALLILNEQQFYLFGQIQTSQMWGLPYFPLKRMFFVLTNCMLQSMQRMSENLEFQRSFDCEVEISWLWLRTDMASF